MWCVAVAGTSNNKHSGHDLLQQEMDSSSSSLRCTLKLTAADLEHRKYGRLWASKPHWLAWQKAGGDKMRRLHQPQTFRGGEVIIDIGSYIGVDLVAFLRHAPDAVAVHTFEPVERYRTKLAQRVRRFVKVHPERLLVHPFGLGSSNRTACFASTLAASTDEVSTSARQNMGTFVKGIDGIQSAGGGRKSASTSLSGVDACVAPSKIIDAAIAITKFPRVDVLQIVRQRVV